MVLSELPLGGDRPRSMAEFAHDNIRQAIIDGRLIGGTRLVLSTLVEELGVSSTPMRDALQRLAHEGLVRMDARKGAEVITVDWQEADDAYEIRAVLEPLAARRAAQRIAPGELAVLASVLDGLESESDFAEWTRMTARFHEMISEASGWEGGVKTLIGSLHAKAAIYLALTVRFTPTQSNAEFWPAQIAIENAEHRKIFDAISARDGDAAEALMLQHILETRQSIAGMAGVHARIDGQA